MRNRRIREYPEAVKRGPHPYFKSKVWMSETGEAQYAGDGAEPFSKVLATDEQGVLKEALRVLRYDPQTGWLFWRLLSEPKGLTLEQRIQATRATFYVGRNRSRGCISVGSSRVAAARIVWLMHKGAWPEGNIRHLNGDTKDDRIENLADKQAVVVKKPFVPKNPKGVARLGADHWQAYANPNGQRKFLGKFKTQAEAVEARARYDAGQDLF